MKKITTILFLILTSISSYATTWDEPWQKEIIEQSEYFVFGKVIRASETKVIVQIEKAFGKQLEGKIIIDDFFMLNICSSSGGHGPEFSFEKKEKGYFFLKKGENGNFQIPTPSSGFDRIVDGKVHATYRHTYHQAAIDPEIYELTYTEIWNKFHQSKFDITKIKSFINTNISKDPAGFEEDEIDLFFKQHSALETAYLCGIELEFETLKKFAEFDNFHSQVAALRALSILKTDQSKKYLLQYIQDKDKDNFTKVIAIWSLWSIGDEQINKTLSDLAETLSNEESGFGGNIMDPRVCTHFPSPKNAIKELTKKE
jgi:hypothetical protein